MRLAGRRGHTSSACLDFYTRFVSQLGRGIRHMASTIFVTFINEDRFRGVLYEATMRSIESHDKPPVCRYPRVLSFRWPAPASPTKWDMHARLMLFQRFAAFEKHNKAQQFAHVNTPPSFHFGIIIEKNGIGRKKGSQLPSAYKNRGMLKFATSGSVRIFMGPLQYERFSPFRRTQWRYDFPLGGATIKFSWFSGS